MSTHKDCGEPVRWAMRSDDPARWMPPLESIGPVYIMDESGVAIQVTAYQVHHCDPDKMEAWLAYQRRLESIKGTEAYVAMSNHEIAREQAREQRWAEALPFACPTCGVKKNRKCVNLLTLKKDPKNPRENANPHPARWQLSITDG